MVYVSLFGSLGLRWFYIIHYWILVMIYQFNILIIILSEKRWKIVHIYFKSEAFLIDFKLSEIIPLVVWYLVERNTRTPVCPF